MILFKDKTSPLEKVSVVPFLSMRQEDIENTILGSEITTTDLTSDVILYNESGTLKILAKKDFFSRYEPITK